MERLRFVAQVKWVLVFVLVLGLSSAATVFAEAPQGPPQGAPDVTLPAPSSSEELAALPSDGAMTATLGRIESEAETEQRQIDSPAAAEEREDSGDRYMDLGASDAEQLLVSRFGTELATLDDEPARFFSDVRLVRTLGKDGALVVDDGRKKLIEGTGPILVPGTGGKIDLDLEGGDGGFQPVNPIVDLQIPSSAGEGVEVGETGLAVSQAGAESEAAGRLVEGNVFYPEVHTDTDLLVAPTATGVELFDQLRSADSPETLRFQVEMPAGAQLRSSANAAEVVAADGSKLADVPPPTAVDAQGTEVPVLMHAEGNSLVLDVKREAGEYAYPILVDPIIQEWYYANWYQGQNLQALSNGAWHWNTAEGASSSWVYGSTSCIYSCWGSGRGLYMDMPNGNLPANRWGQWSYSAPNSETYLADAWVSPFWRDEHVNCPGSKYGQPYDYVGMWNETSWNRILYNETTKNNNEGWANLESWGRALIIGMGTSSGISIPCWRDVMAGGARIWLEDWSRPNLNTTSSAQWMDTSPIRLNVSANDSGLGVQKFKATATNTSNTTSEWWTNNSCTGLYEAPCPHTWNLAEGSQPQLSFSPSVLPEGIDKLSVTAYDAVEKPSFTTNEMTVRIDHAAPAITFTGSLTEQETLSTERPFYKVKVVALDGDPKAKQTEPTKVRSGVTTLETELDGQLIEKYVPTCANEPNCGAEEEIGIQASALSIGQHTFKARAKDAFGHVATKELKFTVAADRTPPRASGGPLPGLFSYVESFGSLGTGNGQLNHPADAAVDSKGNVWVADKANNRVEEFNANGEFVKVVGPVGKVNLLTAPAGVTIDPSGNLWVADTGSNRIVEFSEAGEFVLTFGKDVNKTKVEAAGTEAERNVCTAASGNTCQAGVAGSASGQLKAPQGIAATSGGNLWIADTGNSRIQKFGPGGNFLNVLTGETTIIGKMKEPSSIAMGPDGSIWVADSGWNRISQWTSTLALQLVCGGHGSADGQFESLGAIDVDAQGNVYAADIATDRVEQFNEAGSFLGGFGTSGSGNGQLDFSSPIGVTTDSKGNVWVADANNNRVEKWTRPEAPKYASSFGALGTGNGQFNHPADVAIDSKGNVWALDKGNNRIEQFNEKGEFLKAVGSLGSTGGKLNAPAGLAIDPSGNLWVADTANNRIEKFSEAGEFVLTFGKDVNKTKVEAAGTEAERNVCTAASGNTCQAGVAGSASGQLKAPQGIAATSGGNLWIADTGNSRIQKFSPGGALLNNISGEGTEAGKLKEPSSIAMGPDGSIWVADSGNNRIQQWNSSLSFIRQFGTEGTGWGQFKRPAALEVDLAGNVWVGDQNNNRVQEFSERGEVLRKLGAAGTGAGQFTFGSPIGLAVDGKGNLWVADGNNNRVQKWVFPTLSVGPALEALTASATDKGSGVTGLTVKLANEAKQVETLDSTSQSCSEGGCSMKSVFEGLDLSGKPAGTYTLIVEATDGAGNPNLISSRFTLSTSSPQLALSGALAEGAGEPMTAASGELTINASETGDSIAGIRRITVEVEDQRVAARTFNCAAGCQEVNTSYRFSAARDGAARSIETAATPTGALTKNLTSVSCLSAGDCTAVGYYKAKTVNQTLVERWNGTAWQAVTNPNPANSLDSRLESISCTSASNCLAVGWYQTFTGFSTLIERWNGTAWSILTSPNPAGFARNYLYGVSCAGASDCWGVGKSAYTAEEEALGKTPTALFEHWNGSEWTVGSASKPTGQLKSVSCTSATFCLAVSGTTEAAAERWNGTSWTRYGAAFPSGGSNVSVNGVSCLSETNCTAVGSYSVNNHTAPLAERWNGAGFTVQKTIDPVGTVEEAVSGSLTAVSCVSTGACTAVGTQSASSESAPLIEGWDGTDWALQPAAVPSGVTSAGLSGAACPGAFNCYAVGSKGGSNALIERELADQGSKTVTVEATDKYGNAVSKSINVDVPENISTTPTCNQEASTVASKAVVTATGATSSLQSSVPAAVAASEATVNEANGEEVDPTYSQPKPNLEGLGTPTGSETEVSPEGGFAIEGVACIAPATTTSAATEAKVVNGDAAVFANTAPETDTLLRPNVAGITMVQSLRGSSAPTTISWNVTLNPDENLVELPSGAVAITRDGTEATGETPELSAPAGMQTPAVLKDAELQLETAQYQVIEAEAQTPEEVVAVIPRPWVILSQGSIVPLKIVVEQDVAVPTEYTMEYEMPPFELNFTPKAVVGEVYEAGGATASASSAANCPGGSPCGQFVVSAAVSYAKYWGKPERNDKYPTNYGANNCTNFLSQIMAHGGMGYMRFGEHEDGSWWVQRFEREPGVILYDDTESWRFADIFPRHLWRYGLADIDTSNQPSGWQTGDILAEDWYHTNGKGDFNHVQFVSGTRTPPGSEREPLIANSSEPDEANYAAEPWIRVKGRINAENPEGWNRVALVPKHRWAIWNGKNAKKHDPANLYNSGGVFQG